MDDRISTMRALCKITHFLNITIVEDHACQCFALKSMDKHSDPTKPIECERDCDWRERYTAIGTIEELLEGLLKSKHIFVPEQNNTPFGPQLLLRCSNPFYSMSIEEALVKADLESCNG